MNLPFEQVNVFTDQLFQGNPLSVFWKLPPHFPDSLMQQLAREMNLSKTIFITVLPNEESHYTARIFTPEVELPFAGHPSMGGFFVLTQQGLVKQRAVQHGLTGSTALTMDDHGLIWLTPPPGQVDDSPIPIHEVAEALGAEVSWISGNMPPILAGTGLFHLIVPLVIDQVSVLRPDRTKMRALGDKLGVTGIYVLALSGPSAIHARFFSLGMVIEEDSATGSAASAFGTYLLKTTGTTAIQRYTIYQGVEIGRPSVLLVRLNAHGLGTLEVGGSVVRVLEGTVQIPDAKLDDVAEMA